MKWFLGTPILWLALASILTLGCQAPNPEQVVSRKGNFKVVKVDTTVANDIIVLENNSSTAKLKYREIQRLSMIWPVKPGHKPVDRDNVIPALKYSAWKLNANAIIYLDCSLESDKPDSMGYLNYIASAIAIHLETTR